MSKAGPGLSLSYINLKKVYRHIILMSSDIGTEENRGHTESLYFDEHIYPACFDDLS